jgi:hypothetical protein
MKSTLEPQETIAFDREERRILEKTGVPPVFAQFLKEKSLLFDVAFALRANSPTPRYLMPAAPKPSSVKAKTGNWGFTKGVIAVDPELGKIEKLHGKWFLIKRSPGELPKKESGILQELVHTLSLQEVLAALNGGEFRIIGTEQDIQDSGYLVLQPENHFPDESDIIFSINFNEKKSRIEKQCKIDFAKMLAKLPAKESKPLWWKDEWGKFEEALDNYYPALYKHANDTVFHDILAYGIADETNKVLPVTGDQDLLWISVPSSKQEIFKDFETVINTFEDGGIEKLYGERIALYLKLGGKPDDAEKSIRNGSIAGLGSVTPFESYIIDEVNLAFSCCGVRHLRDLIQHAADNHNPDHPSPLDAIMLHVWRGRISLTRNENDIIHYVMQPGYPNENIIDVHPKWDMTKWSTVINMQIALKQPIPLNTLQAFRQFRNKNKMLAFLPWVKKAGENE